MVMSISDRIYCLESGSVIAEGSPDEVRNDPVLLPHISVPMNEQYREAERVHRLASSHP